MISDDLTITLEWSTNSDTFNACDQDLDLYINVNEHKPFRHSYFNCPEILNIYATDADREYSVFVDYYKPSNVTIGSNLVIYDTSYQVNISQIG